MKKGVRGKKAQFYLVAAIIIVVITSTMIVVSNYSSGNNRGSEVDLMGDELKAESSKILDYDNANSQDSIEAFTEEYSKYAGDEVNIVFIYGTESSIQAYTYENDSRIDLATSISENQIFLNYGNEDYQFNLNRGKNFYFIISKDIRGEKYVYTN